MRRVRRLAAAAFALPVLAVGLVAAATAGDWPARLWAVIVVGGASLALAARRWALQAAGAALAIAGVAVFLRL